MDAIRAGGDVLSICKAWLKGWDESNLADDSEYAWTIGAFK
jgi:hypothetical protein